MPICYIMVGPPAVGKSTWVERNCEGDATILSTDAELERIADVRGETYNQVFTTEFKAAERIMWDKAAAVREARGDVYIDRTNMTAASRKKFIDYFKVTGDYDFIAVVFELPTMEEWVRRLNNRPGKIIPKHIVDRMTASFEMPEYQEGYSQIDTVLVDD